MTEEARKLKEAEEAAEEAARQLANKKLTLIAANGEGGKRPLYFARNRKKSG